VRGLLRQLKNNQAVWYAPDQNYSGKQSVFAPFFGIAAATTSATARLAAASGAAVVPFFQERLPGTRGYRLVLEPALEDFPGDDPAADTARVNAVIEEHVRRAPAQYLWVHRRFKTRPAGEAPVYGD
jgi:KDO2-lipid IV(A) lauroyltransferase